MLPYGHFFLALLGKLIYIYIHIYLMIRNISQEIGKMLNVSKIPIDINTQDLKLRDRNSYIIHYSTFYMIYVFLNNE